MSDQALLDEFDRTFLAQIERHRLALTDELRERYTTSKVPTEVGAILFESHADWFVFPVWAHAIDANVHREIVLKSPLVGRLLPEAGPLVEDDAIDDEHYEDADFGIYERGASLLARWFADRWHEAGGTQFPRPAFISLHDSQRYYELRTRTWHEKMIDAAKAWGA